MNVKEQKVVRNLLVDLIKKAKENEAVVGDNPQVAEFRQKAKVERQLAEAVLDAMYGDTTNLKIYAK